MSDCDIYRAKHTHRFIYITNLMLKTVCDREISDENRYVKPMFLSCGLPKWNSQGQSNGRLLNNGIKIHVEV